MNCKICGNPRFPFEAETERWEICSDCFKLSVMQGNFPPREIEELKLEHLSLELSNILERQHNLHGKITTSILSQALSSTGLSLTLKDGKGIEDFKILRWLHKSLKGLLNKLLINNDGLTPNIRLEIKILKEEIEKHGFWSD